MLWLLRASDIEATFTRAYPNQVLAGRGDVTDVDQTLFFPGEIRVGVSMALQCAEMGGKKLD